MNLVVGATGFLGQEICRQMRAADMPVRALVRGTSDPGRTRHLSKWGAELVTGDLKDGESLAKACRNVCAVVSTASCMVSRQAGDNLDTVDRDGQLRLIQAAEQVGVRRFAFISLPPVSGIDCPLMRAKRAVEGRLHASSMVCMVVKSSCFMEAWLSPSSGFDYASGRAVIYGTGARPLHWVSLYDVARAVVAELDSPAPESRVLELRGPHALSLLEVVRVFEEVSGRTFLLEYVPVLALQMQQAQAEDPIEESFAAMRLMIAAGDTMDLTATVSDCAYRLTSISDYACRVVGCTAELT